MTRRTGIILLTAALAAGPVEAGRPRSVGAEMRLDVVGARPAAVADVRRAVRRAGGVATLHDEGRWLVVSAGPAEAAAVLAAAREAGRRHGLPVRTDQAPQLLLDWDLPGPSAEPTTVGQPWAHAPTGGSVWPRRHPCPDEFASRSDGRPTGRDASPATAPRAPPNHPR
jgi:hypothetical protein